MRVHKERVIREVESRDDMVLMSGSIQPFITNVVFLVVDTTDTPGGVVEGPGSTMSHRGRPTIQETVYTPTNVWGGDTSVVLNNQDGFLPSEEYRVTKAVESRRQKELRIVRCDTSGPSPGEKDTPRT